MKKKNWSNLVSSAQLWLQVPLAYRVELLGAYAGAYHRPSLSEAAQKYFYENKILSESGDIKEKYEYFLDISKKLNRLYRDSAPAQVDVQQLILFETRAHLIVHCEKVDYETLTSFCRINHFIQKGSKVHGLYQSRELQREPQMELQSTLEDFALENKTISFDKLSDSPHGLNHLANLQDLCLLYFSWDKHELMPGIRLSLEVSARMNESTGPVAPKPLVIQPQEKLSGPLLFNDMLCLLKNCHDKEWKLRQDAKFFSATKKAISKDLVPMAAWSEKIVGDMDKRIDLATRALLSLKLISRNKQIMKISERGKSWMVKDQQESLLDLHQNLRKDDAKKIKSLRSEEPLLPGSYHIYTTKPAINTQELIKLAFKDLKAGEFYDFKQFQSFQSRENNPLKELIKKNPGIIFHHGYFSEERGFSQLQSEPLWAKMISNMLLHFLPALGGTELVLQGDDGLAFSLTQAGFYYLGISKEFVAPQQVEAGTLIVSADFNISFLKKSYANEILLANFCERLSRESVGALFKITPKSIRQAAASGLTAKVILRQLTELSCQPLPMNVEHEIGNWLKRIRKVHITSTTLIRCPDQESALIVQALLGVKAELITKTIISAKLDTKSKKALLQKLEKKNILIGI